MKAHLILIPCLLLSALAYAEKIDLYDKCDKEGNSLLDVNICASGFVNQAKFEMTRAYKKAYDSMHSQTAKANLARSQKAWIKYRDEQLKAAFSSETASSGGAIGMRQNQLEYDLTQERIEALSKM